MVLKAGSERVRRLSFIHVSRHIIAYMCLIAWLSLACLSVVGCSSPMLPGDYGTSVEFLDNVENNSAAQAPQNLATIALAKPDGTMVTLGEFFGEKQTLLVVSRGVVGSGEVDENGNHSKYFCIFCSTQTSRLIANFDKFRRRDVQVILLFPLLRQEDASEVQRFSAKVQGSGKTTEDFPFPILLDVELQLVDALGIRDDLSKPSTYVFDANGQVVFAYVGRTIGDRPSIKAMLDQLDRASGKNAS